MESQNGYLFFDTRFERLGYTEENGHIKGVIFQTDIDPVTGLSVFVVNKDILEGRSLDEVNKIVHTAKNLVADNIVEAVVHESGHAKMNRGKTPDEIKEFQKELIGKGIAGISDTATPDGCETIAEIEVLLYRGVEVSADAMEFYRKYVR